MSNIAHRRRQLADRQQQQRRKSLVSVAIGLLGVLLLSVGIYLYVQQGARPEALTKYTPADVATQESFVAVHEMGDGPPIPFLPTGGPQPNVVVPEASYDFGRVGPQDVVEKTFVMSNNGDAPLTISRAYTTCGCTTAEFSASVIPPGKVATVKVIFDAGFHDTAGQTVRRGIIIENNDPDQSQTEIWVQAAVGLN
ncbi:MAG: DUF1573 domain-containing protein [Candidatus Promineifilaceae bacterium]|nr:DUF1573 domain-containing protein [Candidatus Promineifilaceae bacterium]